jgi:hypothetical protein
MSTKSSQAKEAGETSAWQAALASKLSVISMPEFQALLGPNGMISGMFSGRDSSGRLGLDASALRTSTDQLNRSYGQAGFGNDEYIRYNAVRSGEGNRSLSPANSMMQGAATSLERDRQSALANLNFMSAQSSMSDYNKLLGLMGQGVQTSMGLAQGFSGASNAALGGLSTQTQMGSALGGMSAGASLGAGIGSIVPGLGTIAGGVIGGVIGGVGGYLGSRP